MACLGVVLSAAEVVFVRDTGYSLEKGVSLHECTGKQRFPFHDTGNFAENGVSLQGVACLGVVLFAADVVVFVRDTGYFSEKGVSLHECSGKRVFPFATQVISRKMVCRGREVHENIVFSFAIQVILQTKVCRGECEVRKEGKGKALGQGGMVGR